ncbi:hypothetical protein H4R19_003229 [Coemansia spiralis]|nr:hypothetical protein H4R19_003229 [Coemansia spiralis]
MDLLSPGRRFESSAASAAVDGLVVVLAVLAAFTLGKGRALAHAYSRTAVACIAIASVALASSHSRPDAASYLRLLALLSLPLIAHHRWGAAAAPFYCVLNAQAALRTLAKKALYVQEIQLIRLSRQRPLVLGDLWKVPERFRLSTIRREFKYNVEEPMFLFRAIGRLVWRPMLPLLAIQLLMELGAVVEVVLTGYLHRYFDSASEYLWYYGYGMALVLLAVKVAGMQNSRLDDLISAEMSRAEGAICLELFRLPLEPNGQRKFGNIHLQLSKANSLIQVLTTASQFCIEILGLWAKLAAVYYVVGWLALIPIVSSVTVIIVNWGFEQLVGPSYYWSNRTSTRDDTISEVYQGIGAIKLFGWERMYLDPELQEQGSKDKQLPWYAPIVRLG